MLSSCPPLFRHELSLNTKKILFSNDLLERNLNSKQASQLQFSERRLSSKSTNKLIKSARVSPIRSIIELSKDAFNQSEKIGKPELFLLPRSKNGGVDSYPESAQRSTFGDLTTAHESLGNFYNNIKNFYGEKMLKDDGENTNRISQGSLTGSYSMKYYDVTNRDFQILSKRLLIKREKANRLKPIRKEKLDTNNNGNINRSSSPPIIPKKIVKKEAKAKSPRKEIRSGEGSPKFERYCKSRNGMRIEYRSNGSNKSSSKVLEPAKQEKAADPSSKVQKDDSDSSSMFEQNVSSRNGLNVSQGKNDSIAQVDEEIREESLDGELPTKSNADPCQQVVLIDDPKYRLYPEIGSKVLLTANDPGYYNDEVIKIEQKRHLKSEPEVEVARKAASVEKTRPTRVVSTSMLLLEKIQEPRKKKLQAREQYIASYKGLGASQDRMWRYEKGLPSIPLLKKIKVMPEDEVKPREEFQYKANIMSNFKIYDLKSMMANPTKQSFSKLIEILAVKDKAKIKPVKSEGSLIKRGRTKSVGYTG